MDALFGIILVLVVVRLGLLIFNSVMTKDVIDLCTNLCPLALFVNKTFDASPAGYSLQAFLSFGFPFAWGKQPKTDFSFQLTTAPVAALLWSMIP